jgi:hypothetical protein
VICLRALQRISPGGTTVFSQSLNWDLTADVTRGPWKGTNIKRRPQKGVSVFQGHRRKRHLFRAFQGISPKEKHSANRSLPRAKHSAKTNTRQRADMPRARLSAKKGARQTAAVRHRQLMDVVFAEFSPQGTRQRTNLPSAGKRHSAKRGLCREPAPTLGKHILFFSYFCNQTFCIVIIR